MHIEWDHHKNLCNQKKHGISFEDAQEVINDPLHISILNQRISTIEERWITVGQIANQVMVVVARTYMNFEGEEKIRIISARKATKRERQQYEGV